MKQPSSFQAGGSSPGMRAISSRPQADGRVIGSGSDAGASSPASASGTLDACFTHLLWVGTLRACASQSCQGLPKKTLLSFLGRRLLAAFVKGL